MQSDKTLTTQNLISPNYTADGKFTSANSRKKLSEKSVEGI